jgi:KDO2-lipid IV(A) lauroyltransferase
MRKAIRYYVRYPLEAAAALLGYGLFALLPVDIASGLGGWLGRTIGPRIGINRRALRHIGFALPDADLAQRRRIAREMWDNLGRVVGEYPHLAKIAGATGAAARIEFVGEKFLEPLRSPETPGILFSGHLANWEVFAPSLSALGIDYAQVYRAPNNPLVRRMIESIRVLPPELQLPKGATGARMAIAVLKRHGELGMLVDQKLNDGIAVPFFGHDAMTPPALAQLALKFDCVVIPVRLERTQGCRFRVTFSPPLELRRTGDHRGDVLDLMTRVNRMLEDWIRDRPGQWLWLHRRWPKDVLNADEASSSVSARSSDRREAPGRAAS